MAYTNDVITISGSFENSNEEATDPTDLALVVTYRGAPTIERYELSEGQIARDGVGAYHMDWVAPVVQRGRAYYFQWQPTGAVQRASQPEAIYVQPLLSA